MLLKQATLDEIGRKHGTEKSSVHRDVLQSYERFFAARRQQRLKILEIGTLDGASLKTWAEYFQFAAVVGADLDPNAVRHEQARVVIETLDPSNLEELVALGVRHGPFDIIIDNGSHPDKQAVALRTLFAFLDRRGIYVVENLRSDVPASSRSSAALIRDAIDMQLDGSVNTRPMMEDAFLETYGHEMDLFVSRGTCLIEKRYVARFYGNATREPFVVLLEHQKQGVVSIVAHVAHVGDILSTKAVVRATKDGGDILGFQLNVGAEWHNQIKYRARVANGEWTEWVHDGIFIGARDCEQGITGFSVCLLGNLSEMAEVALIGAFRGDAVPVFATGSQDCVGRTGLGALHGMQLVMSRSEPA